MTKRETFLNVPEHNHRFIPFSGIAFGILFLGNYFMDQSMKIPALIRRLIDKLKPKLALESTPDSQITEQEWDQAMQDAIGHAQQGDWRRTPGKVTRINKI